MKALKSALFSVLFVVCALAVGAGIFPLGLSAGKLLCGEGGPIDTGMVILWPVALIGALVSKDQSPIFSETVQ